MTQLVYIVQAYRWGDSNQHCYIVGVFSNEDAALTAADAEEDYRGGKYACEVVEWRVNSSFVGPISRPEVRVVKTLGMRSFKKKEGGAV
jgi:maltoporin